VLCGYRALVPQEFRGLVIEGIGTLAEYNPPQFSIMKATLEGVETINLLPDIVGDHARTPAPYDLDIAREEPQHPLLAEAPVECPDRIGMCSGFVGALGGRTVGKEHQRANDLVAPLDLIHQPQLQWGKLCGRVHGQPLLSVVWEKGVRTTRDCACHCEEEGKGYEVLRTRSASLRIYVKETVTRVVRIDLVSRTWLTRAWLGIDRRQSHDPR
jgi:hypothetical protein